MGIAIELFFLSDIVINFMSTYRDKMDIQVSDRGKIAYNYITSWFFIDLISSIPVDTLIVLEVINADSILSQNQLLRFLKLPK